MVGELVRWMSSACDGVEHAEFVQSWCEDCRAHAVLSSSWLATERDGMVGELVRWMSSASNGVELAEFVQRSCEDCIGVGLAQ